MGSIFGPWQDLAGARPDNLPVSEWTPNHRACGGIPGLARTQRSVWLNKSLPSADAVWKPSRPHTSAFASRSATSSACPSMWRKTVVMICLPLGGGGWKRERGGYEKPENNNSATAKAECQWESAGSGAQFLRNMMLLDLVIQRQSRPPAAACAVCSGTADAHSCKHTGPNWPAGEVLPVCILHELLLEDTVLHGCRM